MNLLTTGNSKFCPQPKPKKQPKPKYPGIRKVSLKKAQEIKNNPQASSRQAKSKSKPRELAAGEIKRKYKPTGEKSVFDEIWEERPHICQVTGDPIPEFSVWCFMHVLSKGAFPRFRLDKRNILLVTRQTHIEYDNGDRSHEMFDEVRKLAEYLKFSYYSK